MAPHPDLLLMQWSNDEDVHNAGTGLSFGLGTVFCWLQSIATLRLNLRNEGRRLGIIRFVLSAAITLSMLLCILFTIGSF